MDLNPYESPKQAGYGPPQLVIRIRGKRPGYTMLDARNSNAAWCTLQVHVQEELYTPAIPEWRFYQMSWEYYNKVVNRR